MMYFESISKKKYSNDRRPSLDGRSAERAAHGVPGSGRAAFRLPGVRRPHEHLQQGAGGDGVRGVPSCPPLGVEQGARPTVVGGRVGRGGLRHAPAAPFVLRSF